MTQEDYIKDLLNIECKNIHLTEINSLKRISITRNGKKIETKLIKAKLTYKPKVCKNCGCINENFSIISNGYKKGCKVKINKMANYSCMIILDKQRFYCKNCNKTFTAETDFIDFHKQISNPLIVSIKQDLTTKSSAKDIAFRNNVSSSSVSRILEKCYFDKPLKRGGILPRRMGIDEFKATKDTKSKMALIIVDQDRKEIFDVQNSRLSKDIFHYFMQYSYKERRKVELITVDLYAPYYKLLHALFPNATIVSDRFHIVIQFRDALDNYRISLCKKSNPNYKKLKKYWKLILKNEAELSDKKTFSKNFKKEISQIEIVEYLINTDKMLKRIYNIYQGVLKAIKERDIETFWNIINHIGTDVTLKLKTTVKTMIKMKKYITNAFESMYSNGIVEGTNNFIKSIIRFAYGFRKFNNLKARIMLCKQYKECA